MVNRSTSNKQGEVAKPSPTPGSQPASNPVPNTVKRSGGPTEPTDVAPNSEPLAEQPRKPETEE